MYVTRTLNHSFCIYYHYHLLLLLLLFVLLLFVLSIVSQRLIAEKNLNNQ